MDNEAKELAERIYNQAYDPDVETLSMDKMIELITAHDNLIRASVKLAAADFVRAHWADHDFLADHILAQTLVDEQAALDARDAELLRKRTYKDFIDIFNDYQRMDRKTFDETHGDDISAALDAFVNEKVAEAVKIVGESGYTAGYADGEEGYAYAIRYEAPNARIAALKEKK